MKSTTATAGSPAQEPGSEKTGIRLFLCGDVMTGRGIDQILPHPSDPRLYEGWVKDARQYVALAEREHGEIPQPVDYDYVWGEALAELERAKPDLRIVNLETSITTSDEPWPHKGIHYRMHPQNVPCLTAAGIDCCVLANNHVLDWGHAGLIETLETLEAAGIATVGAGRNREQAEAPAIFELPGKGRVLLLAFGHGSSGIPPEWAAGKNTPGVSLLPDLSEATARELARRADGIRRDGDVIVVSIHWGGNWGYDVPAEQRRFARLLVEQAGIALIHGHSSHHAKGIELIDGCAALYGCGDFLTDYEGISGHEQFRDDLPLMYLPTFAVGSSRLSSFEMVPLQLRRFQLTCPSDADIRWLHHTLERECARLAVTLDRTDERRLALAIPRAD